MFGCCIQFFACACGFSCVFAVVFADNIAIVVAVGIVNAVAVAVAVGIVITVGITIVVAVGIVIIVAVGIVIDVAVVIAVDMVIAVVIAIVLSHTRFTHRQDERQTVEAYVLMLAASPLFTSKGPPLDDWEYADVSSDCFSIGARRYTCVLPSGRRVPMPLEPCNTLRDALGFLCSVADINPDRVVLLYAGRQLLLQQTVEEEGIVHGGVIHVVLCAQGGGVTSAAPSVFSNVPTNPLPDRAGRPVGTSGAFDLMNLLYSMLKGNQDIRRSLTQLPPVPPTRAVRKYLDMWYASHRFAERNVRLAFVVDGRRCAAKIAGYASRDHDADRESVEGARTRAELEKVLKSTCTVTAQLVLCVKGWAKQEHLVDRITFFGAPFEADAQMVALEQMGFVDYIISEDSDLFFYGAKTQFTGFKTCRTDKYRQLLKGETADRRLSALRQQGAHVALTGLLGTDYIDNLKGHGPVWVWKHLPDYMKLETRAQQDQYLREMTQEWISTQRTAHTKKTQRIRKQLIADGLNPIAALTQAEQMNPAKEDSSVTPESYVSLFRQNEALFKHYPVFHIKFNQRPGGPKTLWLFPRPHPVGTVSIPPAEHTVTMEPLTPFSAVEHTFASVFPKLDFHTPFRGQEENPGVLSRYARMEDWAREPLLHLPQPTNAAGVPLPHGAVLDFDRRPPHLVGSFVCAPATLTHTHDTCTHTRTPRTLNQVHTRALRTWLACRNVKTTQRNMRHTSVNRNGRSFAGVVELVNRELRSSSSKSFTLAFVDRHGIIDPVPYKVTSDAHLTLRDNTDRVLELLRGLVTTEENFTAVFGIRNADRERVMKLFRNGHLDIASVKVAFATSDEGNLLVVQAKVVASQRDDVYETTTLYDPETGLVRTCMFVHVVSAHSHYTCHAHDTGQRAAVWILHMRGT